MARLFESKVTKPAAPKALEHSLPPYLASDEALIHALNRSPGRLFDVNGQLSLGYDEAGHADGEGVLKAVKAGKLSVTLRNVEQAHPGLWAEALASFQRSAPSLGIKDADKLSGQLILSSESAHAPYDFAATGIVMFHLRGVKRIWIYPPSETSVPQTAIESAVTGVPVERQHSSQQDAAAWRFDLVPGEALATPLYAPHRIENQEGLCVTLVLTYETIESIVTNGAHAANAVLRRKKGRKIASMDRTPLIARVGLSVAAFAFQLAGIVKKRPVRVAREFVASEPTVEAAAPRLVA